MKASPSFIERLASEPYRIFFPLGIFWGIFGVGHWLFYALGWLTAYSGFLHSAIQMQAYMGSFVAGFLLTAAPRFAAAPPLNPKEFILFLSLSMALPMVYFRQWFIAGEISFILWIFLLLFILGSRFRKKRDTNASPPTEFVWIPVALLHGLAGAGLLIAWQLQALPAIWGKTGKLLLDHGFMLSIVVGVGGFLAPRLMGVHRLFIRPGTASPEQIKKERLRWMMIHLLAGLFIFSSFFIEAHGSSATAYGIRAIVVTSILIWTGSLTKWPLVRDQFVWMVWASFWFVAAGHWGLVFFPAYRLACLHIIFIGGYALMTFAVATMVILSHGGSASLLKKPHAALTGISAGVAIALIFRLASEFFPEFYFQLLGISSSAWLIAAVIWLSFLFPFLFHFPQAEEAERCHEEAKARVARMRGER